MLTWQQLSGMWGRAAIDHRVALSSCPDLVAARIAFADGTCYEEIRLSLETADMSRGLIRVCCAIMFSYTDMI